MKDILILVVLSILSIGTSNTYMNYLQEFNEEHTSDRCYLQEPLDKVVMSEEEIQQLYLNMQNSYNHNKEGFIEHHSTTDARKFKVEDLLSNLFGISLLVCGGFVSHLCQSS
jgi:hypothetical protein